MSLKSQLDRVWPWKELNRLKAENAELLKQNRALVRWIEVTHRVDQQPQEISPLKQILAVAQSKRRPAAVRVLVGALLMLSMSASAQLPPILRNYFTTNAAPVAVTNASWTNSYQPGSAILTNASNTGVITNASWTNSYQPGSAILTNASNTGVITNASWTNTYQVGYPALTNLGANALITNLTRLDTTNAYRQGTGAFGTNEYVTYGKVSDLLSSFAAVNLFGATNPHAVNANWGTFQTVIPPNPWTNSYALVVGTNTVGCRFYTNPITAGLNAGAYVHRVWQYHSGAGNPTVTYYSTLCVSDGLTYTNVLSVGSPISSTTSLFADDSVTYLSTNYPVTGATNYLGVIRYAVRTGGSSATFNIVGGSPYDTHLETPSLNVSPAYISVATNDTLVSGSASTLDFYSDNILRVYGTNNSGHADILVTVTNANLIKWATVTTNSMVDTNQLANSTNNLGTSSRSPTNAFIVSNSGSGTNNSLYGPTVQTALTNVAGAQWYFGKSILTVANLTNGTLDATKPYQFYTNSGGAGTNLTITVSNVPAAGYVAFVSLVINPNGSNMQVAINGGTNLNAVKTNTVVVSNLTFFSYLIDSGMPGSNVWSFGQP